MKRTMAGKYTLWVLVLMHGIATHAQPHPFNLDLSLDIIKVADRNFSPSEYEGGGLGLTFAYRKSLEKSSHIVSAHIGLNKLFPVNDKNNTDAGAEAVFGRFEYTWLKQINGVKIRRAQLFLGSGWQFNHLVIDSQNLGVSWYNIHSLPLTVSLQKTPSRLSSFELSCKMAILSLTSRPEPALPLHQYQRNDAWSDHGFVFFHEQFLLSTSLNYHRFLSEKLNLSLSYELLYIRHNTGNPFESRSHLFSLGLNF